jgi:heterodisulfide reductase subunit A-like polyferredoxin
VNKDMLVIGGGIAGIQSSLDLAEMGFKVHLVERLPSIGGKMAQLDKTFPDQRLRHLNTFAEDAGCRSTSQY